jgi:hypothetical protein
MKRRISMRSAFSSFVSSLMAALCHQTHPGGRAVLGRR